MTKRQAISVGVLTTSEHFFAERRGQGDLMILLVDQDLVRMCSAMPYSPVAFPHCRTRLPIMLDRLIFVVQVEPQHILGLARCAHRLGVDCRFAAQVVDLLGDGEGMAQLFGGMLFPSSPAIAI